MCNNKLALLITILRSTVLIAIISSTSIYFYLQHQPQHSPHAPSSSSSSWDEEQRTLPPELSDSVDYSALRSLILLHLLRVPDRLPLPLILPQSPSSSLWPIYCQTTDFIDTCSPTNCCPSRTNSIPSSRALIPTVHQQVLHLPLLHRHSSVPLSHHCYYYCCYSQLLLLLLLPWPLQISSLQRCHHQPHLLLLLPPSHSSATCHADIHARTCNAALGTTAS